MSSLSRHATQGMSFQHKKNEDDADRHLAQKIMQNKQYSTYGQADDEYDFDDGPRRKSRKKQPDNDQASQRNTVGNRFSIKQEDCIFCYENPRRPAHLVVAVANFTYLMLPQWEPVVPGHCCILPMQVSLVLFLFCFPYFVAKLMWSHLFVRDSSTRKQWSGGI